MWQHSFQGRSSREFIFTSWCKKCTTSTLEVFVNLGLSEKEINFFYLFIYLFMFPQKCLAQGRCPSGHFHRPFYKSQLMIYPFHWSSGELGILNSIPGHLFPKACPAVFAASESCGNSCTNEKLHFLLAAQPLCFSAGFPPRLVQSVPSGLPCCLKGASLPQKEILEISTPLKRSQSCSRSSPENTCTNEQLIGATGVCQSETF